MASTPRNRTPSFEVIAEGEVGNALVVGLADVGAATLTAVDYLVNRLESTRIGRIRPRNLPIVAPVSFGEPRYPIRLYTLEEADVTVLVSEVFVPAWAAEWFAETVLEWAIANGIEEIAGLYGAPLPHSESEHVLFYAASETFRSAHFDADDVKPLQGGVIDGVNGELLVAGLDAANPATGLLVTPVHPPGPDYDAALRLLGGVETLYDVDVAEDDLRARSEEMRRYYEEFAARLETLQRDGRKVSDREFPHDRMYM